MSEIMGPLSWRPIFGSGPLLLAQRGAWKGLELTLLFADLATFAAYAVIPLLIVYFLLRRRRVHFSRVWFLLVVYLIVGGAVHVLDAFGSGELGSHRLGPLAGVGEEAFFVPVDGDAGDG